ncbi:MAG: hypothetical protein E7467_08730 [Ruminococcaceae bacterium]|nr:hypothetical protein [Oscillospiraceae bacterium]
MKTKCAVLFLLLSVLLGGCRRELTDYTLSTVQTTETSEVSTSNAAEQKTHYEYATYPVKRPADHVIGNCYYYKNSRVICYYDVDIRRKVVLCSQPNCTHGSEECVAYLGGNGDTQYLIVGDTAYALVVKMEGEKTVQFISRNVVTGETELLWDLSPKNPDTIMQNFEFSVDGNTAFLAYEQFDICLSELGEYSEQNKATYAFAMDLTNGEREQLMKCDIPYIEGLALQGDSLICQATTEDYLLIRCVGEYEELPLGREAYLKENPYGDYEAYLNGIPWPGSSYYSVNRRTGERFFICREGAAKIQDSTGPFRDKKMSFADGDTICIYDGRTGQVTRCFTRENIAMQMYKDGRIIYNVCMEDGSWEYYWYDLTTGQMQQFQKGESIMIFAVHEETADYFYGYSNGENRFISKQDWYNENYDAAF